MTSEIWRELLRVLDELDTQCPDVRFSQLIAHLATLAKGSTVEAIWDAEDEGLLQAARQQLAIFRARHSAVAP